jgi:transposase
LWEDQIMAGEYWLDDEAWAAIEPLLPKVYAGARRKDDRPIISGIVHVLHRGCRWIDCPAVYGPPTTIYNRFNRWSPRGRWQAIFDALVKVKPKDIRLIDSSSIKAQRSVAGGKGARRSRQSADLVTARRRKSMPSRTARDGSSAFC